MNKLLRLPALALLLVAVAVVPSALASSPSSTAATRLCADIAASQAKIVILGDSIMTEAGASSPERGWPQQLKAHLEPQGWSIVIDKARWGSKALDFAPGGQYAAVTDAVRDLSPTLVTMDWKINEQWVPEPGVSPDSVRLSYLAIIDRIRATSPTTAFMIVNPPLMALDDNGGIDNYTIWIQEQYRTEIAKVQTERGTLYQDLRPGFPTGGARVVKLFAPDKIHLNDEGHTSVFNTVLTKLTASCG